MDKKEKKRKTIKAIILITCAVLLYTYSQKKNNEHLVSMIKTHMPFKSNFEMEVLAERIVESMFLKQINGYSIFPSKSKDI